MASLEVPCHMMPCQGSSFSFFLSYYFIYIFSSVFLPYMSFAYMLQIPV